MEALDFGRQFVFAHAGALMESPPITGLLAQFEAVSSQAADDHESNKEEPAERAETPPEPGQPSRLVLVAAIDVEAEGRDNRNERSWCRWLREGNQRVGAVVVHAPQW